VTAPAVVRFRWWHIDAVLRIEQDLFQPEPWSSGQFWSELGQTETRHYVVALDGDQVVGYAGLCDYPDEAFVQTMAVARPSQGKGIGTALLEDLLAEAGRRRHSRVLLEVRVDNEPAKALYARHGFRQESVRKGYYPGGIDALVLVRTA
jgi:ribosomal-protein-alanine N-acetyltransferase